MTVSKIFFDPAKPKDGVFELQGSLKSEEGRRYEIDEWLGRGGNAAVYSCTDRGSGDPYAVKFLLSRGYRPRKRFLREVELMKSLDNDHVIKTHGSGTVRADEIIGTNRRPIRIPFLIMDRAQCNLTEVLDPKSTRPAPELYMGQFRGLAGALAQVHGSAIHRDIKPENILVIGDRWLLSDYGLCAFLNKAAEDLTGQHGKVGPTYWLSPEAHNRRIGHPDTICAASDVYQLAAVFWYVATGRHPSGCLAQSDWSGPQGLYEPIARALLHDVSKRPANGQVFLDEISAALAA
ncbi:protein kinase domain-containing protein [Brevundimonas naejangsanensis]|uniref:protein kinase domain-containing protein n=1 Tax=Brevundimonas naejangsanensis TaxID=588932 RepID=UPI003D0889BE